ncbi:hypothetical protein MLD38_020598 [Melastoma candidum]|uniref:Uncharacterized protein n=1 Tax=Melastoma candidum TaxID=119954 RepID=A0ACB9QED2_9MYRT|nr:hypothetical protein MLD38_020598 [Melastoma candidum]
MKAPTFAKAVLPVLAIVVAILVAGSAAQSTICNVTVAGLETCLPAVRDPNPQPPTEACCKALKPANFPCFCQYKNNPIVKAMGIDINLAMKLPAKCNIKGAPSHC